MTRYLTVAVSTGPTSERLSIPLTSVAAEWASSKGHETTDTPVHPLKTDIAMAICNRDKHVRVAR